MKLEAFDNLNKVNSIITEKKQNVSETDSSETKENKETKTNETNKKTSKTDSWKKGKSPPTIRTFPLSIWIDLKNALGILIVDEVADETLSVIIEAFGAFTDLSCLKMP